MSLAPFGHQHSTTRMFLFGFACAMIGLLVGYIAGESAMTRTLNQFALMSMPAPVFENHQHDHYNITVDADTHILADGNGMVNLTLNVPETLKVEKVDPMDALLQELDKVLRDLNQTPTPAYSSSTTDTRPEIWPNQITSPDQIEVGMCVYDYNDNDPWGPFTVVSDVYPMNNDNDLFVDLMLPDGLVIEHSLADMGVIPYESGRWNANSHLIEVVCPQTPTPSMPTTTNEKQTTFAN